MVDVVWVEGALAIATFRRRWDRGWGGGWVVCGRVWVGGKAAVGVLVVVVVVAAILLAVLILGWFWTVSGHVPFFRTIVALRGRFWVVKEVLIPQLVILLVPESSAILGSLGFLVGDQPAEINIIHFYSFEFEKSEEVCDMFLIFDQLRCLVRPEMKVGNQIIVPHRHPLCGVVNSVAFRPFKAQCGIAAVLVQLQVIVSAGAFPTFEIGFLLLHLLKVDVIPLFNSVQKLFVYGRQVESVSGGITSRRGYVEIGGCGSGWDSGR